MESHRKWRLRARAGLEAYFRNRSFPRFGLGLIVTLGGLAGFLISHTLLHHGFEDMWLRYPLAVIGGYLVFLGQLRLWVEIERARYDPKQVSLPGDPPEEKESPPVCDRFSRNDSGSWFDWLDLPTSVFDFDEGCLIGCVFILLIGLLTGASGLLLSLVMTAPELLAEVFLDAFVVAVLYRHLKSAAKQHWLGTAVKRTWKSAILTAVASGVLGLVLAGLAPHSHSIGPAVEEIFAKPAEKEDGLK